MPKPYQEKRKWLPRPKISLRSALIAMAVVALGCWWVQNAERQRFHFNEIQSEEGGPVSCQLQDTPAWLGWLPDSVQSFRGGHYFRGVKRIYIGHVDPSDREAQRIAWRKVLPLLPWCQMLDLSQVTLRDFHFTDLERAKSLEQILFTQVLIDPETHAHFPPLIHLEELAIMSGDFRRERFVAARFDKLVQSKKLKSVVISDGAHLLIDQLADVDSLEFCMLQSKLITDEAIGELSRLPMLKELRLNSPLSDTAAESIAKIKTLEIVRLENTQFTDLGVGFIATLPNLKEVYLDECLASPVVGESLASAEKLETVSLRGVYIDGATAQAFSEMPNLKSIDLQTNFLNAGDLVGLVDRETTFSSLMAGISSSGVLEEKDRAAIAAATNPTLATFIRLSDHLSPDLKDQLKQLNIAGDEPEVLTATTLDLSGSDIDDDDLRTLQNFSNLEALNLSYTNVTDEGLKLLLDERSRVENAADGPRKNQSGKLWPKLRWLNLSGTKVGPLWVEFASRLPDMQSCLLNDNLNINDGCFADLKEGTFSKLWILELNNTNVGNEAMRRLSNSSELRRVSIKSTLVDDDAVPSLLDFKKLTFLHIFNTRLTTDGIQALTHAISEVAQQEPAYYDQTEYRITQPLSPKQIERLNYGDRSDWYFLIDSPDLTFDDLKPLQKFGHIQGMSLRQCDLSVDDLVELRGRHGYEIELVGKFCEEQWLGAFAASSDMKCHRLRLKHDDLGIEQLRVFNDWEYLAELSLSGGQWKREDMKWVAGSPGFAKLQDLNFTGIKIGPDVFLGLENHPTLQSLKTPEHHLGPADCNWLLRGVVAPKGPYVFRSELVDFAAVSQAMPNDALTQMMSFNATNFSRKDWQALTRFECLSNLTVVGGALTRDSIDCLAQLPFLQTLHLEKVSIDGQALSQFKQLPKLKRLTFTKMDLNKIDWRSPLSSCKLSEITITNCGVATRFRFLKPIHCPETGHYIRVFNRPSR